MEISFGDKKGFKAWFSGLSRKQKIIQSFCLLFFVVFFLVFAVSSIQSNGYSNICKEMGGYYKDASKRPDTTTPMGCYLSGENYKKNEPKIKELEAQYYHSLPPFNFYIRLASWVDEQRNWHRPYSICLSISSLFDGKGSFCQRLK